MDYKGIKIYEEPRHGSVKRVQRFVDQWYAENLPLKDLTQTKRISEAISKCMEENPAYLFKFQEFMEDRSDYQEIMLATVLTVKDIDKLGDEFTSGEFREFVETCEKATGGVDHFFGRSSSGISLKNPTSNQENSESMNSPSLPGGSIPG